MKVRMVRGKVSSKTYDLLRSSLEYFPLDDIVCLNIVHPNKSAARKADY